MRCFMIILVMMLLGGCRTFEIGFVQTPMPTLSVVAKSSTATSTLVASPNLTPTMQPTSMATIAPIATKAWPQGITDVLPAPLYFLSDRSGSQQIWRVETDEVRLTQTTSSLHPVEAFDISRVTGKIAYVSGNALIIGDELGNTIQVIDTKSVSYRDNLSEAVASLAWSPDGTRLAFAGRNGLWLYNVTGAELVHLVTNPDRVSGMWLDAPHAWSPDGSALLLRMMYSNSDTGDVIYVPINDAALHVTRLSVCYNLRWSLDGRAVYASLGMSTVLCPQPGLARWSLDSDTVTEVISSEPMNQSLLAHFVAGAEEGHDGFLYYFYGNAEVPADELRYGTLKMFRSTPDNVARRVALRDDGYGAVFEVLWTDDMSAAIIVDGSASNSTRMGAIILLTSDNKPSFLLAERGFSVRWGKSR